MGNIYSASKISGGVSGCLDHIDPLDSDGQGTLLTAGDIAFVFKDDAVDCRLYRLFDDGSSSDPDDVIIPSSNSGSFAWKAIVKTKIEAYIGAAVEIGIAQTITHSADPGNTRLPKSGFLYDTGTTVMMLPDCFEYEILSSTQTRVTPKKTMGYSGDLITYVIIP